MPNHHIQDPAERISQLVKSNPSFECNFPFYRGVDSGDRASAYRGVVYVPINSYAIVQAREDKYAVTTTEVARCTGILGRDTVQQVSFILHSAPAFDSRGERGNVELLNELQGDLIAFSSRIGTDLHFEIIPFGCSERSFAPALKTMEEALTFFVAHEHEQVSYTCGAHCLFENVQIPIGVLHDTRTPEALFRPDHTELHYLMMEAPVVAVSNYCQYRPSLLGGS